MPLIIANTISEMLQRNLFSSLIEFGVKGTKAVASEPLNSVFHRNGVLTPFWVSGEPVAPL